MKNECERVLEHSQSRFTRAFRARHGVEEHGTRAPTSSPDRRRQSPPYSTCGLGLTRLSMTEYRKTPPIPMPQPRSFMKLSDSPRTRATPTITMTRLAVLATDWVTAVVFLRVIVE